MSLVLDVSRHADVVNLGPEGRSACVTSSRRGCVGTATAVLSAMLQGVNPATVADVRRIGRIGRTIPMGPGMDLGPGAGHLAVLLPLREEVGLRCLMSKRRRSRAGSLRRERVGPGTIANISTGHGPRLLGVRPRAQMVPRSRRRGRNPGRRAAILKVRRSPKRAGGRTGNAFDEPA